MHYAKYNKTAVGSILTHSERGIGKPDVHSHSNECIDSERTHLNYDMKDRDGRSAYEYYRERIEAISKETKETTGKSIRKDAVTLCSWVVTAPVDLPEEKHKSFFEETYHWFSERYGAANIVAAAVHMDETTPHLHLQFTPIIEMNGARKLCAKNIENRNTLKTAHADLQRHLESLLGCPVPLLNGATEQGNRSVLQLKVDTLKAEVDSLKLQLEEMTQKANNLSLESKKGMFESSKSYEHRQAIHAREQLADEREKAQTERENKFAADKFIWERWQNGEERRLRDERESLKKEKAEIEKLIAEKAQQIADEQISLVMKDIPSKKNDRMRRYMDCVHFSDGKTALEHFEEQEKQLERDLKKSFRY